MSGPDRIRFTLATADLKSRVRAIRDIFTGLAAPVLPPVGKRKP